MRVRADILRIYQSLHTWTGITAGLLLFIGFYAGSLTMFKHELQKWIAPRTVHAIDKPTSSHSDWQALVDKALDRYSTELGKGFDLDLTNTTPVLSWYSQGSARDLHMDNKLVEVRLDPQGQLTVTESYENKFGDLIDYLHRSAGIGGEIGHDQAGVYVLGIAAVLYFLALVSGIVVLLPTLVKSFFALRRDKGPSRFWLDSHNLVGVASLPFHFIIAWTVVSFAFHDQIYGGLTMFYGEQPLFQRQASTTKKFELSQLPPIEQHIATAIDYSPAHQPVKLSFMRLDTTAPALSVKMLNPNGMMRGPDTDYLSMHPYTLEIQPFSFSTEDGASYSKFVIGLFSLHFGTYAGNFGRWSYFIMGLLGAFLFYSGNLLWLDKRMKNNSGQRRSCRIMAALTIGICLGSMLAVALTMLFGKLLGPVLMNINYAYLYCYYLGFITFIGYSFWRGAAVAAYHGLGALALCCAALPLTTLYLNWQQTSWHEIIPSIGVDIMALVFAFIFLYAAHKSKVRMSNSTVDGVWCLQHKN